MGRYKFSENSIKIIDTTHIYVQLLIYRTLDNSPYDFGIPSTGGKRTPAEQKELFDKGWSKLDGYEKKSYHQTGMAIDIFLWCDEHNGICYKCKDKYKEIAGVVKEQFNQMKEENIIPNTAKLTWGGDWKTFIDLPHFQIKL